MFFCLRALTLLAPLAAVAAIVWLGSQARQLRHRVDDDLIIAVRTLPDSFNPLLASRDGAGREITALVFDTLLRLDDDLHWRPHLLESWGYRHRATCHFLDPEKAAAAAARLEEEKAARVEWMLEEIVRDGDALHLVSANPRNDWLDDIVRRLDPADLAPLLEVRLTLREAVAHSLADFLSVSVEKNQLRHLDYDGDREARLYLLGDTDLFLKELRLYYESNSNLEPVIEVLGPVNRLSELDFDLVLREGLRWHDGEPVTADDLVFTFEEITRPGSTSALRHAFDFVESVERLDELRVRAHCRRHHAPALESWGGLTPLPAHHLRQAVGPAEWGKFFARPVGTGPYRIESVEPAASVTLRASDSTVRAAPGQETLRYVAMPDSAKRRWEWRLGTVDIMEPDAVERRWLESGAASAEWARDAARHQVFVAWNLDRPALADPRVRRALTHLIDRGTLLEDLPDGGWRVRPWTGLFFPGAWFGAESVEPLAHDVERAIALLTGAGWVRDATDGRWRDQQGQVIDLTLSYDARHPLHSALAERLEAGWQAAGVGITLDRRDRDEPGEEPDALLLGWELEASRDQFAIWHSSRAMKGGTNFTGLRNQEVDRLLEKLRTVELEPEVVASATELRREIRELQPCLFLCSLGRELALRPGAVEQARPAPGGGWTRGPVAVGRSGLPGSRPWWVRKVPTEEQSP